jgi:opacity protein-like surface antigen
LKKTFVILLFFYASTALSQKLKSEFGLTAGVAYYMGDINHTKQFYSPKIGFGILYRHNFNPRYAVRVFLNRLSVSGSDLDFSNGYQQSRAHSFSQSIVEFGSMAEFNFLDFVPVDYQRFSPYITAGPSLAYTQIPGKNFQIVIPFGAGIKYALNKRLTLGVEWVFRKTFTDRIDLLYNSSISETSPPIAYKQISSDNTKDWYSFAGIVISYNFASDKKWCPAYNKPKK